MASDISKMLKQAAESCAKEIEREEDKKIKIALNNTMVRVEEKLDEILTEYMVNAYYNGYSPTSYVRSFQLGNAVKSYTEAHNLGTVSGFTFGAIFDESKMNHSLLRIRVRYYLKRQKKWVEQEYPLKKSGYTHKANELAILEAFQDGIHPNATPSGMTNTPNGTPLFNDAQEGAVPDIIESWVENGGIQDIFLQELNNLY